MPSNKLQRAWARLGGPVPTPFNLLWTPPAVGLYVEIPLLLTVNVGGYGSATARLNGYTDATGAFHGYYSDTHWPPAPAQLSNAKWYYYYEDYTLDGSGRNCGIWLPPSNAAKGDWRYLLSYFANYAGESRYWFFKDTYDHSAPGEAIPTDAARWWAVPGASRVSYPPDGPPVYWDNPTSDLPVITPGGGTVRLRMPPAFG